MDMGEESLRSGSLRATTIRNLSSSSSAFYSANQSPFFSPRTSTCLRSDSSRLENIPYADPIPGPTSSPNPAPYISSCDFQKFDQISTSTGISNSTPCSYTFAQGNVYSGPTEILRKHETRISYKLGPDLRSSNRPRSCDVFIGFHGSKPSLLRFANWLQAELEVQGMSCFVSDQARCGSSRKHRLVERAMDVSSFGVVILTKKSFKNPYTIEELRFFSGKKNLVPIFFGLGSGDCLARDIIEKRGDLWEKNGGELWVLYGGLEKEWKEAVHGLSRVDEWKLEAQDENWRECIFRAVTLLAMKLGRRSVVERLTKLREKVEKEEFPFHRNENFIGRKKEISELEFILFGNIMGDSERDYLELKARPRRKNVSLGWSKSSSMEPFESCCRRKGKEPVVWKESEKEIEMQSNDFSKMAVVQVNQIRPKSGSRYGRRKRSTKILYGKGIACVSGESGIGKTELLLEFAYRYHQRYKMVLWVGGESRYIRQNYLNLWTFLEVDVGVETCTDKTRIKSFEEQEEAAILKIRKELMRNMPFLVIIDNLESEKDWWDHKVIMDLLPRFGGETHIIISTRLPRVMNLEPLKLSYLSGIEAMSLMQGNVKDYSINEIDALRSIEEKVGRLTLGLAIVGSILSELPISPSRLLDTTNRMPLKDMTWSGRESQSLRWNTFLLQLFEVCFSIFDHAEGPRSLAAQMVQSSGWFGPGPIPVSLLSLAAYKIPEKHQRTRLWRKLLNSFSCGLKSSFSKKSEVEATSMLIRFNIAKPSSKQGYIQFNELVKLYARKRGANCGAAQATVQAIMSHGSITQHPDHLWAACFLLFGLGKDPVVVKLKVLELLCLIKEVILPFAIRIFLSYSRCSASLDLLRLCTDQLEAVDQEFVTPVEKWLDKSLCWRPVQTSAQLNPYLWQELALCRANVLETRAKLMLRGGQFDIGDDLIRKAVFIRTSICGDEHPDTISARETLSKLTRLLANAQVHNNTSP